FHSLTHAGDWHMNISSAEQGIKVQAFDGATPFYLKSSEVSCEPRHEWYLGCYFAEETERGLSDREDRLFAGLFRAKLEVGSSITLIATTKLTASLDGETARAQRANHDVQLFQEWQRKTKPLRKKPLHGFGSSFSPLINSSYSAAFRRSRTAAASLRVITG